MVAEACVETNDLSDHDRRVLARSSAKFASEVFQFTLTCSHGPIFICFVCVTTSLVAPDALICSLLFSKCSAQLLGFLDMAGGIFLSHVKA